MALVFALIAAGIVAAFAKTRRNRSFIFWFLGTLAATFALEWPLHAVLMDGNFTVESRAFAVAVTVGGVALLLAAGSSRKPKADPGATPSAAAR